MPISRHLKMIAFEFAYAEAPEELKGIMTGMYLLAVGCGSYAGSLVIAIVNGITNNPDLPNSQWVPKNINDGHLDYYFFFLSGNVLL